MQADKLRCRLCCCPFSSSFVLSLDFFLELHNEWTEHLELSQEFLCSFSILINILELLDSWASLRVGQTFEDVEKEKILSFEMQAIASNRFSMLRVTAFKRKLAPIREAMLAVGPSSKIQRNEMKISAPFNFLICSPRSISQRLCHLNNGLAFMKHKRHIQLLFVCHLLKALTLLSSPECSKSSTTRVAFRCDTFLP